ncbi:MAG: molybdopterin-guanine dinucleotide biosynthesis protein B [Thermoplasmata archaeon]
MIIGFYGPSDSGKTTMIIKLVEYFKNKNYKIIAIKHVGKDHKIDVEGKDTYLYKESGADISVGISEEESAIFMKIKDLDHIIKILNKIIDNPIIFIEGFKDNDKIKKIKMGGDKTYPNTVLESNDFDKIKNFIEMEIEIEKIERDLPGLNCGDCGYKNCRIMAENIFNNKNRLEDCKHINDKNLIIFVNGNRIYLNDFMQKLFENTIKGMLSSLKGVDDIKNFKIMME